MSTSWVLEVLPLHLLGGRARAALRPRSLCAGHRERLAAGPGGAGAPRLLRGPLRGALRGAGHQGHQQLQVLEAELPLAGLLGGQGAPARLHRHPAAGHVSGAPGRGHAAAERPRRPGAHGLRRLLRGGRLPVLRALGAKAAAPGGAQGGGHEGAQRAGAEAQTAGERGGHLKSGATWTIDIPYIIYIYV